MRAEVERLKEEHREQIQQVTKSASTEITKAKTESEEREKLLRAEIDALKRENMNLKDTDKLQKEQAETMAQKMESWRMLAQKLNEKMEGWFFHTFLLRVKTLFRVMYFPSHCSLLILLPDRFLFLLLTFGLPSRKLSRICSSLCSGLPLD